MNIQAKTQQEFFEKCGVYETVMRDLDRLIRRVAPNLKPELFGGMSMSGMGYGMMPYKYASGKTGTWPLIGLAPQKNYASLYICATKDGKYYAETYQDRLGKVSCGRSCIRFKKYGDINMDVVEEKVIDVAKRHAKGETLFGI